jgi:hypothetical protein
LVCTCKIDKTFNSSAHSHQSCFSVIQFLTTSTALRIPVQVLTKNWQLRTDNCFLHRVNFMVKPNGRLVLVSCMHCCTFTSSLSTRWSSWALLIPYGLGDLILRSASRLYAFSGYHYRTSLPSGAIGMTARTQEVRPSRSSRTKDRSSQISCAHNR